MTSSQSAEQSQASTQPARPAGLSLRTHLQEPSRGSSPSPGQAPGPPCARLRQNRRGTGAATPGQCAPRGCSGGEHAHSGAQGAPPAPGFLWARKAPARYLRSPASTILISHQWQLVPPSAAPDWTLWKWRFVGPLWEELPARRGGSQELRSGGENIALGPLSRTCQGGDSGGFDPIPTRYQTGIPAHPEKMNGCKLLSHKK